MWRLWLLLCLVVPESLSFLVFSEPCITPCRCSVTKIDCWGVGDTSVPSFKTLHSNMNQSSLDLGRNFIQTIHSGAFHGLNLTWLTLSDNPLSSIDDDVFTEQHFLKGLHISNAKLTVLPSSLGLLWNLESLDFSHNAITNIDPHITQGIGLSLTQLDISYNNFTKWPAVLRHLQFLERLIMENNPIKEIPFHAFDGFKHTLKLLYIGNTKLTRVPDAVQVLTSLRDLTLHNNSLGDDGFPPAIFDNSKSTLYSIFMSNTSVTHIPDAIRNLTNLNALYIGMNKLEFVPSEHVKNLQTLGFLSMYHCNLHRFPAAVKLLPNLVELGLGDNSIDTLEYMDLEGLSNLTDLYLDMNGLRYIAPTVFAATPKLRQLTLRGNNLTDVPIAIKSIPIRPLRGYQLFLDDNPIECTCNLAWMSDWVGMNSSSNSAGDSDFTGQCGNSMYSILDYVRSFVPHCR